MKIIISPAKKLNFESSCPFKKNTQPRFLDQTNQLIENLKEKNEDDIAKLMKLSQSLAQLNTKRYQEFRTPFTTDNAKQALYAFQGDTYQGLNANDFDNNDTAFAQKSLRILSGLYGVLRPMDLIQPYRLEMGTRLKGDDYNNLYQFWDYQLTKSLNKEIENDKDEALINLASKEYFSSIKFKEIKTPVVTCHFMQKKGNDYKIISFNAKRARGMMSRFIIKNRLSVPSQLTEFNEDGYYFDKEKSSKNDLIFKRDQ